MSANRYQTYSVYDLHDGKVLLEHAYCDEVIKMLQTTEATFRSCITNNRALRQRFEIIPENTITENRKPNIPVELWEKWRYLHDKYNTLDKEAAT